MRLRQHRRSKRYFKRNRKPHFKMPKFISGNYYGGAPKFNNSLIKPKGKRSRLKLIEYWKPKGVVINWNVAFENFDKIIRNAKPAQSDADERSVATTPQ